jgi:hypothetical protein
MIRDALLNFSEDQAVTATAVSTNVLDIGLADPNMGAGLPKQIEVRVEDDFATLTSLQVVVQDSADNSTFAAILEGPVVLLADLVSGARILTTRLPDVHRRYLRLNYVVAGSDATAGSVNADILKTPDATFD